MTPHFYKTLDPIGSIFSLRSGPPPYQNFSEIFLYAVIEDELIKIIKTLNKKSAGEDNIPPNIVKACQNQLLKPLLILINRPFNMLNEGIFPDNLKIAKVIPIYKKMKNTPQATTGQ